ncbi:Scr1 family TA system antitoxin-like transcriptional regulator [Streptomyces virginiae]|uniref:Scr1 family TA system antitoxin-like transcriptional regulator n=1 Tax=Streptomyces virginiae TaxID=1961 RepID=UPI003647944B
MRGVRGQRPGRGPDRRRPQRHLLVRGVETPQPGRAGQSSAGDRPPGRVDPRLPGVLLPRLPGLLQTPAYAAAVIAAYGTFHRAADDVEAATAARVKRSKVLHKRGRRFAFLIEESVLHSRITDPDTTGDGHHRPAVPAPAERCRRQAPRRSAPRRPHHRETASHPGSAHLRPEAGSHGVSVCSSTPLPFPRRRGGPV